MNDWDHQQRGVDATLAAIRDGYRRILLTCPTGGGKTLIAQRLIERYLADQKRVVLYSNRKMLVDQTSDKLIEAGHYHGIRAAGYEDERDHPLQISSLQTENSRVLKKGKWKLHDAQLVIVDEAHLNSSTTVQKLLDLHLEEGNAAALVGLTATPLDLAHMYDKLIVAGNMSELRACGALVPAWHYGPDEPDLKQLKRGPALGADLSEEEQKTLMGKVEDDGKPNRKLQVICGRVLDWFWRLNPDRRPTILFAPGVKESIWFAEQFKAAGISAAHIDGENVWINGEFYKSSRTIREQVLAGSKDGTIVALCNRFVLREGLDLPWLAHGILATVFGSLQSYLQASGRLLRAFTGLDHVSLQDHGGNWWRHGSVNADREWRLELTNSIVAAMHEDRFRLKQDAEPFRCPQCGMILSFPNCKCGWEAKPGKKSRPVLQADGTLREMSGDIFRAQRIYARPDAAAKWKRMYYRSKTEKGSRTFRAAAALFAVENYWQYPSRELPLMPIHEEDWYAKCSDVPWERLIHENKTEAVAVDSQADWSAGLFG